MTTDMSERGLEILICKTLTGSACNSSAAQGESREETAPYTPFGWLPGKPADYDREYCVDLVKLTEFLSATQDKIADELDLGEDSPTRRRFLSRLQGEISRRGIVDVLRKGVQHGAHHITLFYGTPSAGNPRC